MACTSKHTLQHDSKQYNETVSMYRKVIAFEFFCLTLYLFRPMHTKAFSDLLNTIPPGRKKHLICVMRLNMH